jgi:hypothetical protein
VLSDRFKRNLFHFLVITMNGGKHSSVKTLFLRWELHCRLEKVIQADHSRVNLVITEGGRIFNPIELTSPQMHTPREDDHGAEENGSQ